MKSTRGLSLALGIAGAALVFFGVGVWLLDRPSNVKDELDPVAVSQMGVTLLVGFFLTQYVVQRTTERKAEKGILIDNARGVLADLRETFDAFEECCDEPGDGPKLGVLRRCFKRLSADMSSFEDLLMECGAGDARTRVNNAKTPLFRFKRLATGSLPTPPSAEDRVGVETSYRELHQELSRLVVTINRL